MAEIRVLNSVGATVTIDGVERESVTVDAGTTVRWSVSKEGYVTQEGDYTVWEDTVLPVVLKREEYTITFNVSPALATLTVNGSEVSLSKGTYSMTAKWGDTVSWSCVAVGYSGQNGNFTATEDRTVDITLEEEVVILPDRTIKFVVSPDNATLTVNGTNVTLTDGVYTMTAQDGDVLEWSCERDGYVSQSGSHTVSGDATITITLEEEGDHHITVDPDTLTLAASGVSAGSRNSVTVDSDGSWTAEAAEEWVVLSASEGGSGTTGVTVRAETNTSGLTRRAEVTFTNEWGNTAVLAVTQEGDFLSGGDPGGDDPDPEDNPDTITASTRAVASGEEFTLTLTGTTATLDATLTNMSATVGTFYLTIDGSTYELDTQTTSIAVAANTTYRCVLESSFSGVIAVLFAHGDASVTVTVHQRLTGNSDAEEYSEGEGNENENG